jgi:hypothetical protein
MKINKTCEFLQNKLAPMGGQQAAVEFVFMSA